MEFLRFIKWQWGQIHRNTKQLGLVIMVTIMSIAYCVFFPMSFVASIVAVVGTLIVSVIIIGLYEETSKAWNKYKEIKERDAEQIMTKLRGHKGSVTTPGKGFF